MTTEEQNEEDTIIREYECGYLLVPSIAPDHVGEYEQEIRGVIEKHGGTIVKQQAPEKLPLAYEMSVSREGKKDRYVEAFFGWITFTAESNAVNEMKNELSENGYLIRFMIIRADSDQPTREELKAQEEEEEGGEEVDDEETDTQDQEGETENDSERVGRTESVSDEELDKSIEGIVEEEPSSTS